MRKVLILIFFTASLVIPVYAQSADNLDVSANKQYPGSEYVLGRPVESTYEYNLDLRSAQVAFTVDETYSMRGPMNGVRDNIKWFFEQLGGDAEGTVIGSGCGSSSTDYSDSDGYHCLDRPYPGDNYGPGEPRDLAPGQGLISNENDLVDAADNLEERNSFEGPDSTVSEAVNYGPESSDYTGNIGYYGDEDYNWGSEASKAIIWVQSGGAGYGSCSGISDFSSGGLGRYMEDNNFEFYAIVRSLSGCRSNFETAASNTGGKVYDLSNDPSSEDWQDILGEISSSLDTSVRLNGLVDQYSYSEDNYDEDNLQGNHKNFRFLNAPESSGQQSLSLTWRPVDIGNLDIKSGESFIEVEQSDGSFQNFYFNNQQISEVKYVDFELSGYTVERDDSQVNIEAEIANNGNVDSLGPAQTSSPRELFVKDSSSTISTNISSISAGDSENVTLSIGNSNSMVDGNNIEDLFLHVDAQGFWDGKSGQVAVPDAEGEALEPNENDNEVQIGYPPRVRDIQFSDISGQHAFSVEAKIDILTDGNDFGECRLKFTNQENGNEYPSSGWAEGQISEINGDTASCTYDNFNSSVSGFEPTDNVEVNITAENDEGATGWNSKNHEIINRPPVVSIVEPKDSEPVWNRDATLRITVDDPEGDNIELIEYWDNIDNNLIQSMPNPPDVNGEGTFSADWQDLNLGEYSWRVEVDDKWDTGDEGPVTFERVVSQIYRVDHTVDHQYSSLIVDEGGQASMFFESDVATNNRTVTTYVEGSGIGVEYADGSTQKTYEVDTGQPHRFQLRISALDTGKNELRIITEDDSVSTNTTTTFPVYVRESVSEGQSVPGLALIQIITIFLTSILFYYGTL